MENNNRFEEVYEKYRQNTDPMDMSQEDEKEHIVAVRKNDEGDLIAFQTSSGRQLDYLEALNDAKAGKLAHVDVFQKYGRDILRSEPDGIKENNLDNLPEF